jgi:lipoprotein-releasing system permease protein
LNFPLFIAKRIYTDNQEKRRVSKPVIRIATAGVAIGLAVMIISVCVVLGFKHTIRDKVVGFGSHIQVADFLTLQSSEQYPIQMGDSMMKVLKGIEGVKHVQRYAYKQGILKTDNDFLGVVFKGVGPEFDSTFIHQNMVEGHIPHFSDESSGNKLVISKTIANQMKLQLNQKIFCYFIDHQGVRARKYTIVGIYQTNLSQYDKVICLTDLYSIVKLNGWEPDQASGAEVTVHDFNHVNEVEDHIIDRVNRTVDKYGETYSSQTIQELNPSIFSWLDLLDMNVWIILALMTAVAGVTMISGLLIIILERTNMIGVMKAMGTRNKTIRQTFLWFAAFIIGKGLLWGNILGIGLLLLQKYTSLIKLDPSTYYVSTVPIEFNIPLIILINIATMLICVLVLIAPSYLISHIHPVKAIRYE